MGKNVDSLMRSLLPQFLETVTFVTTFSIEFLGLRIHCIHAIAVFLLLL